MNIIPFAEQVCQKRLNIHHVLVQQDGIETGSFHFAPAQRRADIHSATKSVVSLAAGIAIGEGLVSLESKPVEILKNHLPERFDPNWEQVTLKDLLTMSSGHRQKLLDGYSLISGRVNRDDLDDKDWVHYAFTQDLAFAPGSNFVYNNACAIMVGRMIETITKQTLKDWLRPRLFDPLNIHNPQWLTDPIGNSCGPGGLQLSPEEFSRFARLCLDRGEWNGQQLVPRDYIDLATKKQISTWDPELPSDKDATAGYGFFFWMTSRPNSYLMNGWGGQLNLILSDLNATVTITAYEFRTQDILDLVWKYVLPELNA